MPTIRIAGLRKRFPEPAPTKSGGEVLRGLDLSVADGESLVLIGESGSGKTLLLKLILGLQRPGGGSIEVDGLDLVRARGERRRAVAASIGMLFQRAALFDSLPVWRNVAFRLLSERGHGKAEARELAIAKLRQVGLGPDTADLLPGELSGGMQKRVGIARAIATDPEILLLDEPTAGLDPIMSNVINELILDNVRRLGATVISITSDMAGAVRIADRIAMIHDGVIAWSGPPAEVERSGNPHVAAFIRKWQAEKAAAERPG